MIDMTMQVPDELAERIRPIRTWLPAIIDLSLVAFRPLAIETAPNWWSFSILDPSSRGMLEISHDEPRHRRAYKGSLR